MKVVKNDSLNRKRVEFLLILFALIIIALIFRVGYWQIIKADWLKVLAQEQWGREISIDADRGDILDTNGNCFALSVSTYSIILKPGIIPSEQLTSLVENLAVILEMDTETVQASATKEVSQVTLKQNISIEEAELVRNLQYQDTDGDLISYTGVVVNEDKKREYPLGTFLTQVLGFVSIDDIGLEGLESRFDKYLAGTDGKIIVETDRDGNKIPGTSEERIEPIDGNDLQLTIDMALQSFAESALDKCIEEQGATSATCIVMDPNTGKILAMVNKPDYDNNVPPRNDIDLLRELTRNKAITDVYEPGSTFKIITTASAIDSGAVDTSTTFYCPGYRIVDGQRIKCWSDKPHGTLNLTGAVQNSCNPAFMDMALRMGTSEFYNYIYNFGFGSKTGIKMYGESAGIVTSEKYVKNVDLARIGFGQAIAVTPLQLVTGVSAVVNGGNLMAPYIAEAIISPEEKIIEEYDNEVVRTVISEETSAIMRDILLAVVDNGSGRNAQIEGYEIGGKTGTAQKYGENGEVLHDKHISSFIGIAPMNDPKLVVLIAVNEPTAGLSYGSIVAAPYVKMFLEEALPYLNIMPSIDTTAQLSTKAVPNVTGISKEEAEVILEQEGFGCIIEGYSGNIVSQIPSAGTQLKKGQNVVVQLEQETDNDESYMVEVPDLFGLTPTEANSLLVENNLTMMIVNSGNVVLEQIPEAGTLVYTGTQVSVSFDYSEVFDEEVDE